MPNTYVLPYLTFGGRCEEALEFYKSALGARVEMISYFKDMPEPPPPGMLKPGWENKVMHASVHIGGSLLMASDGCDDHQKFEGFSLSIALTTEAEVEQTFTALADGGKVTMPLAKTFWSPKFGMVIDRFGVNWMVSVTA